MARRVNANEVVSVSNDRDERPAGSRVASSTSDLGDDTTRLVPSTLQEQIERGPRWWRTVSRLTNSPFPMLLFDRDSGAVLDANPAAVRTFGWSRDELLARVASDIFPTLGLPDEPSFPRRRATQWMGPWSVRRKDGSALLGEVGVIDGRSDGQPSMIMMVTPWSPSGDGDGGG